MADILTWLERYSLPVVLLIAVGATLLYFAKTVAEKAITREFNRHAKLIELQLQRRSNFDERILIERYTLLREINAKTDALFTDLTRRHLGMEVKGLVHDGDIVPLTQLFDLIGLNRYLIPQPFIIILDKQAELALQYAHARNQLTVEAAKAAFETLREEFNQLMTRAFKLNEIGAVA